MLTPILPEELSREVLKSYTFNELKTILKELRKQQKEARLNENREEYFDILDDIQKVTFKMRNIIRHRASTVNPPTVSPL